MKRLLSLFAIILITNCAFAQPISMRPNWTYNTPIAEDDTYEYYVSKGVGKTEKEARTDAFVIAVKEAQSRVGLGANSTEIINAFQSGEKFDVVAGHYEIPMKEVCNFSEMNGGQYYYYQLLRVAVSGNITPKFNMPFAGDCYDFSKAKELRKIMKSDFKEEKPVRNREVTDKVRSQRNRNNGYDWEKGKYIAWNITGAGYTWKLTDGIEFRYGGVVGLGAYLDFGMDFTHVKVHWCDTIVYNPSIEEYYPKDARLHSWNTKLSFHYSGGLKFYFFKGLFVDFGYGTISRPVEDLYFYWYQNQEQKGSYDCNYVYWRKDLDINNCLMSLDRAGDYDWSIFKRLIRKNSQGLLFHLGYNLVTDMENGAGFFLGIRAGASYDIVNKQFMPSIMLKMGVAWSVR